MEGGYEELVNAIIVQAANDYRKALGRNDYKTAKECEKFFSSRWFGRLTIIDGKRLMDDLKKEVELNDGKGISAAGVQDKPAD